jgi:acyl-CoA thioesterase FadM
MYPFVRLALQMFSARHAGPVDTHDTHVSHHICLPWDLDPWIELNNGRTLTLYDLGRIPLSIRSGLGNLLRSQGWGMTVAGNSVRYRRRVRMFDRIEMHSRLIGWDQRFFYMEQAMSVRGECTSHMLVRSAVTSRDGIVVPELVMAAAGKPAASPPLPDWVAAWIAADAERPWPPQF